MDLKKQWETVEWQVSDFSYTKEAILAASAKESGSDISKLIKTYRQLYYISILFLIISFITVMIKPYGTDFTVCMALITLYWVMVVGFLTHKFIQFNLPDLTKQPIQAIQATLKLARAINSFHLGIIQLLMPVVFLGSLLATLTYNGIRFGKLAEKPALLFVILLLTIMVVWIGYALRKWLANKQCIAVIQRLEEHLVILTRP